MQILKKFLKTKESAVILMFVVLFLGTAILQPALLTYPQLINLFRTISMSLLPAMGMVFVMTCGSIDLSAGSVLAFSGMLSGYAMVIWGWHPAFAVLLALGFSAITGLINGFLIARWGLTPIPWEYSTLSAGLLMLLQKALPFQVSRKHLPPSDRERQGLCPIRSLLRRLSLPSAFLSIILRFLAVRSFLPEGIKKPPGWPVSM